MKILFAFENPLPSKEADAEVFLTTARYLAALAERSWLHLPAASRADAERTAEALGMPVVRAAAPLRPAALRHLFCGLTLPLRRAFRQADLVYTRNLWIAWISILCGQRVVFDHYRPWPDQIPPLQRGIYRLMCHPRFLVHICHSAYTRGKYLDLGVPAQKLRVVHNGYEPRRLRRPMTLDEAKRAIGVEPQVRTVVYTGRINHKKGLDLVLAAAARLPAVRFLLVGSTGPGPIEQQAASMANVQIVPWQTDEGLVPYIYAADCLLIPPSFQPLARFGSTVLPLKLFLYLASGRPIIAGDSPDVRELLVHDQTAWLCRPDDVDALVAAVQRMMTTSDLRERLGAASLAASRGYTWSARAEQIISIVEERRLAEGTEPGRWGEDHERNWRQQSRRWLRHLLRSRSWVLPPGTLETPLAQVSDPPAS